MAQKKKLQVFVSSTYTDLQEERQAAVQAILTAGHIPAGMELFAAGDQSQMQVIQQWIDESDVFLLILGGRYGSVEPNSGKSYIHLEYEYALEKEKPLFAVIIEEEHLKEKAKKVGLDVIEREDTAKLKEFRALVLTKMVKSWSDSRDIKVAIYETLSEYSLREDLRGWIPGDQTVNAAPLAEQLARLTKENASLREQVSQNTETLRVQLDDTDAEIRYQAAIKLSAMGETSIPLLIKAIKDENNEVMTIARDALINIGESAVGPLIRVWKDERFYSSLVYNQLYQSTIEALGQIGKPAISELIKELHNENYLVCRSAAEALGRVGETANEAVPELIKVLSDEEPSVCCNAAEALGRIGEAASEAVPELIKTLGNPTDSVRWSAVEALGRIGESASEAVPELIKMLKDQEEAIRSDAAEALGRIGTPEAMQAVNNQVKGENP